MEVMNHCGPDEQFTDLGELSKREHAVDGSLVPERVNLALIVAAGHLGAARFPVPAGAANLLDLGAGQL
jgi:hypothetical protein